MAKPLPKPQNTLSFPREFASGLIQYSIIDLDLFLSALDSSVEYTAPTPFSFAFHWEQSMQTLIFLNLTGFLFECHQYHSSVGSDHSASLVLYVYCCIYAGYCVSSLVLCLAQAATPMNQPSATEHALLSLCIQRVKGCCSKFPGMHMVHSQIASPIAGFGRETTCVCCSPISHRWGGEPTWVQWI